jgi:hypothetical protein
MSILDFEYRNKINELKKNDLLNEDFLKKSFRFKKSLDEFSLIEKQIKDDFFIELYKKNFSDILDFELDNDFNYTDNYIYDIEDNIQNINSSKYDKVLDYMLIKVVDLEPEFYGTIINFIYNLFSEIEENINIVKKIKIIWKNKYKNNYPNFSEFQKSNEFEQLTQILIKDKDKNKKVFDLNSPDKSFVYNFLIYTSETSDFYIKELSDDNFNEFLFENKRYFYKKNGNIMLEDIKNKIISYN